MRVGIVTTWFERGAAYVSKIFENVLESENEVFIYARGGEEFASDNPIWNRANVHWGKRRISPFSSTVIDKKDFKKWVLKNQIELIIFNEQHWFEPLIWCKGLNIKTIAYIDYYTEETVPLFDIYDALICNTKRHYSVFQNHKNANYIPWGTQINLFKPQKEGLVNNDYVTFFHSCGWDTYRKGTDLVLKAFSKTKSNSRLVIHTQNEIEDQKLLELINDLEVKNRIEIITKTVHAPGLFHLGDVYVYPSRLEGIGLTIAESISCGLGIIVPDNAPMNEFSNGENSKLIRVEKQYSRYDAYYWPKCEIEINHLTQILDDLADKKEEVIAMKAASRKYAQESLDAQKNFKALIKLVEDVEFKDLDNSTKELISSYETKGFKRFHRLYLRFYSFFNLIRNISKS